MLEYRLKKHPILPIKEKRRIDFFWQGNKLSGLENEPISSTLIANGIHIFGHHPKDRTPMGIFCANGQCSQCLVYVEGKPVKSCIELLKNGMRIDPVDALPILPQIKTIPDFGSVKEISIPVLIIGGGPAGLSAALELGKKGIKTILVDDKQQLGGKLILQTHRFFGSTEAVFAGTRGIDIAIILADQVSQESSVEIWRNTTALGVFSDQKVGILKNGEEYVLIKPDYLLSACGAREKFMNFPGNTLPGVLGAGAFQTLVNRDLVIPAKNIFIVGGGNVGLITGYHAIQAGIHVSGLIEVMPECGGYKVHKDKLVRLGVPILTSHTILSANGNNHVESITIAEVDQQFQPQLETSQTIDCDCILIAIGLNRVDEFFEKAKVFGMHVQAAGDNEEIAEASAAIYSGKIRGCEIANLIDKNKEGIPSIWFREKEILSSKPGKTHKEIYPNNKKGIYPIFHCTQEIPCDPCGHICPLDLILVNETDIRKLPVYHETTRACTGCMNCVTSCPGLAITLVDYRLDEKNPIVSIPYELNIDLLKIGDRVTVLDTNGIQLGNPKVIELLERKGFNSTRILKVKFPADDAEKIAGFKIQNPKDVLEKYEPAKDIDNKCIICRCERVDAGEIRDLIRKGFRDLNEIKTITRAGMGSCGGKTCNLLILQLFKEENIPINEITIQSKRPLFVEVPLLLFADGNKDFKVT